MRPGRSWAGWGTVPAAFVLLLLFGGALVEAVSVSLDDGLGAWRRLLGSDELVASLALTWRVALTSTILAAALGLLIALLVRRVFQTFGGRVTRVLLQVPLPMPHLVVAIAALMLLSQSGLLNRLLGGAALPPLVNDRFGVGIVFTYVWKEAPFIAVLVLSALRGETLKLEEVAQNLGASRWRVLREVTLPAALPALRTGSTLVFAYAFGAFEVPRLLGQTRPSMLGVWSFRLYTDVDLARRPEGMAVALLIFASVVAAALALNGVRGRVR